MSGRNIEKTTGYFTRNDRRPSDDLKDFLKRYRPGTVWVLKSDPNGRRYILIRKDNSGLRFQGSNEGAFSEEMFTRVS